MNSLIFKYGGKEIDLDKKFDDFANSFDKICLGMTIEVYDKKRINEFNELTVNFYFKNATPYPIKCFKENKVKDILNNYASQNSLNIDNLSFKCGVIPINDTQQQQTFYQLINNNVDMNSNDFTNATANTVNNDTNEIDIIVNECQQPSGFTKKVKIIIIISIIILLLAIIFIIIFFTIRKKGKEKSPFY